MFIGFNISYMVIGALLRLFPEFKVQKIFFKKALVVFNGEVFISFNFPYMVISVLHRLF